MSQALQFTLDLALIGHSFTVSSVFVERPYKLRFSLIELGHVIVIGDFWDQFAPQQFSIRPRVHGATKKRMGILLSF